MKLLLLASLLAITSFAQTDFPILSPSGSPATLQLGETAVGEVHLSLVGEGCADDHPDCPAWAKMGECCKNYVYMLRHCADSCDLCKPGDNHPQCFYLKIRGHCSRGNVMDRCPGSCSPIVCESSITLAGSSRQPDEMGTFSYVGMAGDRFPYYQQVGGGRYLYFQGEQWRVGAALFGGQVLIHANDNADSPEMVEEWRSWGSGGWQVERAITANCFESVAKESAVSRTDKLLNAESGIAAENARLRQQNEALRKTLQTLMEANEE